MRAVSSTVRSLIRDGGFDAVWVADLMYGGERRLEGVPLSGSRLSWDGGSFVAGSGSVDVVWSDDHARSMVPREIGDWFAPFGSELQVDCLVSAGSFVERVPVGRFVIESTVDAESNPIPWSGRQIVVGESFTLNLKDTLVRVARDEFPFPTAPTSGSVWREVQSVSGMPVVRNVADASLPGGVSYDGKKDAVLSELFDLLGAWPAADAAGRLTARPKAWGLPVDDLVNVVADPLSMDSADTFNRVVVEGKLPGGGPVYGVAEVTDGPLRVRNADGSAAPFGVKTFRYSSQSLSTAAACDAYAAGVLPRVSRLRGVTRRVRETFNPLREVGDVLRFKGGLVRVQQVTHDGAVTDMVVEVPDEG